VSAVLQEPTVTLRPMLADDVEAVLEIEHAMYEFPWTRGIFRDCLRVGYCCWVLSKGDEVIAYAVLSVAAGESHLLNVCVSEGHQRQGHAARLIKHMLDLAKSHGAGVCLLEVRPSNTAAVTLYEQMNFVEVGIRPNYYPAKKGREDALILALELIF